MSLEADLESYLEHLRSERQVSVHTLDGLRLFVARLHQQGLASRSLARLLSATRGLYQYLIREGRCRHDPADGLAAPKGARKLPRTLDTDRTAQLLD
uniref:site-specific integrase n=1 Tax=Pseudomonas nitroreducens TaxID=46680 RepID=UPI0028A6A829